MTTPPYCSFSLSQKENWLPGRMVMGMCAHTCACRYVPAHTCVYVHICRKTGSLSCIPAGRLLLKEPKCLLVWSSSHKMSQELCKACLTKWFQVSRENDLEMLWHLQLFISKLFIRTLLMIVFLVIRSKKCVIHSLHLSSVPLDCSKMLCWNFLVYTELVTWLCFYFVPDRFCLADTYVTSPN